MSNGWIKIYRKIQDCFVWQDKPYDKARAWIDLLLLAMHHDKKILVDGEFIVVPRGSFMTSTLKLSDRWGWSRNKVLRFINVLEGEQMLNTKRTPKGTLITIVKYDVFQGIENIDSTTVGTTVDTTDSTTDSTTDETQNKNDKELKNDKNINNNLSFSNENDCQTETVRRVVACWNDLKDYGIKPISKIGSTSKRYQSLCARIQQYGIEDVIKAIEKIKNSDFLQGKNKQGWMITFDWFVLPNNFPKVLEGQYDNISPKNDNPKKLERWNI